MITERPTMLTCAQPSGKLHIGNLLGAIQTWRTYLSTHTCLIGIADLHTLTTPDDPVARKNATLETLAQYLACGLDPEHCHFFVQSHITGHTELAWILACYTPLGQLERMTQFKEKKLLQQEAKGEAHAGLLYYPILMAADILIYNANIVPVGDDQAQHLELARHLAQKFNHAHPDTFHLPETRTPAIGARIMDLRHPEQKMSKSCKNEAGILYLTDDSNALRKKIKSAETDSGEDIIVHPEKPGISNLLHILSGLSQQPITHLEETFKQKTYNDLKEATVEATVEALDPLRERYEIFRQDKSVLLDILETGNAVAQKLALKTLSKVRRQVGLLEKPQS